jgi:hypothetical protein
MGFNALLGNSPTPTKVEDWAVTRDDFIPGVAGDLTWNLSASGTGATAAQITSDTLQAVDHPGVVELTTGTTTTGRSAQWLGIACMKLGVNRIIYNAVVRLPTLSTVGEEYTVRLGLKDGNTADSIDGCYFEYHDVGSTANWFAKTANDSTRTNTDTTIVAGTVWVALRIEANTTNARFFINNTLRATLTTNLPADGFGIVHGIFKAAGTTARTLEVDAVQLLLKDPSKRIG